MRSLLKSFTYVLLFIFTISCDIRGNGIPKEPSNHINTPPAAKFFRVTKVVDGDTFWVDNGSEKGLKVRLIGIDAPESRKSFKKDVQYFGKEAATYLGSRISGKKVRLVYDVSPRDRYGRALVYAYLEDGTFVNADLIRKGYAIVMTLSPNVAHADEFARLQQEARTKKRGLWNRDVNSGF